MKYIRVKDCPLCEIFTNKHIITKLYWPENIEDIPRSEFVIVDCKTCKIPMVVYGEHVTSITKEAWGRILYVCKRKLFGGGITLRRNKIDCIDHISFYIHNINEKRV